MNKVLDFVVCKILLWREETYFVDVFLVPDPGGLQYQGSHHLPSNCEGDIYIQSYEINVKAHYKIKTT